MEPDRFPDIAGGLFPTSVRKMKTATTIVVRRS
jgi:hypothetical protein